MATWNELFFDPKNREMAPEAELFRFMSLLEKKFGHAPLRLWDLGCGAGRHTVAMAKSGHIVFASDNSSRAVDLTRDWLRRAGAAADVAVAEMADFPWQDGTMFHGVFSWDVLQHNTLDNIKRAVELAHSHLVPGGMLLATIKSTKADGYGVGREIEEGTFVSDVGNEAGVPHHYFDEKGIRDLFDKDKWLIMALAEQIIVNVERPDKFWEYTPFRWTTWGVLMEKR
jgi:cyclopropane fatty-acyl-phospholipid synthase-like methyltransferase